MPKEVAVGFDSPTSRIAAMHEFGSGDLPERPVIRVAARPGGSMTRAVREATRKVKGMPTQAQARDIAKAGVKGLQRAYRAAGGTVKPVGEAQRARKRGTPGEGRVLVGTEGEVLISRIVGKVDGNAVD